MKIGIELMLSDVRLQTNVLIIKQRSYGAGTAF